MKQNSTYIRHIPTTRKTEQMSELTGIHLIFILLMILPVSVLLLTFVVGAYRMKTKDKQPKNDVQQYFTNDKY